MKFAPLCRVIRAAASLPVRGAWIEISHCADKGLIGILSLPVRGAWIEIGLALVHRLVAGSLPVRGAWIEIDGKVFRITSDAVAPRAGSVD